MYFQKTNLIRRTNMNKMMIATISAIFSLTAVATVVDSKNSKDVFSKLEANTVYIDFDAKKQGSFACVTQAKKDGTVVFQGVISNEEYKAKYSGFWLKDANTCAYWKKIQA